MPPTCGTHSAESPLGYGDLAKRIEYIEGFKRLGQRLRHILCSNSLLRTWQLWQKRHLRLGIRHAVADHANALKGRAADCLPQGGTPPPARFFIMALRGNVFLALGDLCDLGNMDTCKRGEREREREIYWIAYEIITHLCTMT